MAVPITTQQMALTRNMGFMERVQALLARITSTVLSEAESTPYHLQRAQYAQRVVQNPQNAASQAGPQVVMGVNVIQSTTYNEAEKTAECTIADIDLESQILTLWNALGGIDTPS
jgi:hypothetical protein